MKLLFILTTLSCPTTKVVNSSGLAWTKLDNQTLLRATKRCKELYVRSPCLKWFEKYDYQSYRAVCGESNK